MTKGQDISTVDAKSGADISTVDAKSVEVFPDIPTETTEIDYLESVRLRMATNQAMLPLDPKTQAFVRHYLTTGKADAAAVACGFKDDKGRSILAREDVGKAIAAAQAELLYTIRIDAKWVRQRLMSTYEAALEGDPVFDKFGAEIGRKKPWSAILKALELIGKTRGVEAFVDRMDVTSNGQTLLPGPEYVFVINGQRVVF